MRPMTCLYALSTVLGGVLVGQARADVLYTYTGNSFTNAELPYSTSDHLSVTLDFAEAIGPNYGYLQVVPVSFTFTGGVVGDTTSNSPETSGGFYVQTDASGTINGWYMIARSPSTLVQSQHTLYDGAQYDYASYNNGVNNGAATVSGNAGQWVTSVSAVPEPSSLIISIAALASLWGLRRHRSACFPNC
jgi:hypothetical protein